MDTGSLVAIDVHAHATISLRHVEDPAKKAMQEAASQYFKDEANA